MIFLNKGYDNLGKIAGLSYWTFIYSDLKVTGNKNGEATEDA